MTFTDRNRRIERFYASGEDYWAALEEIDFDEDDSDDGFRLTPCDVPIATRGDVRSEPPSQWMEAAAWMVVVVGFLMAGAIAFGVVTWGLSFLG